MNAMKDKFQMTNDECRIEKPRRRDLVIRHSSFVIRAFTLIELLTVISIIGVLAALTFPVAEGGQAAAIYPERAGGNGAVGDGD